MPQRPDNALVGHPSKQKPGSARKDDLMLGIDIAGTSESASRSTVNANSNSQPTNNINKFYDIPNTKRKPNELNPHEIIKKAIE